MFIVGYSYYHHKLIYGIIVIYAIMAVLFFLHIARIRRRMADSVAVYAVIKDYHSADKNTHFYPIVTYTTEDGRDVTTTYTVQDRKKRYEIGSEEMICYDPEDPMFFYFANRDGDLTKDYYRFIVIGAVISAVLFVIAQLR